MSKGNASDVATRAVDIAIESALTWYRANSMGKPDLDALKKNLTLEVRASIDGALADAKAAMDVGMREIAGQTFAASMSLAGIRAAKKTAGVE